MTKTHGIPSAHPRWIEADQEGAFSSMKINLVANQLDGSNEGMVYGSEYRRRRLHGHIVLCTYCTVRTAR